MPRVTVLIPNYNHARFLPRRIESVLGQTFQDFEVVLMDDASKDDSREVIARYAAQDPRIRVRLNERNSGSPCAQWNKGFREAAGEYVWIAESDDCADPTLLEKLVARLDAHPKVGIAYCQSLRVDENGAVLGSNAEYTRCLDEAHWAEDYVADGRDECSRYMIVMNTIPNASAALLRRSVLEAVGYATESMRLSGDHHLWVKMLLASDVAFVAEPLNHFRHHGGSVRGETYLNGVYLEEAYAVRRLIFSAVSPDPAMRRHILDDQVRRWYELVCLREGHIPWRRNMRIFREGLAVDAALPWRIVRHVLGRQKGRLVARLARPRSRSGAGAA